MPEGTPLGEPPGGYLGPDNKEGVQEDQKGEEEA